MPDTWITNIEHFLDENGDIEPIEGPARKIAEYFTEIISSATSSGMDGSIKCRCRRRPDHKRCKGIIETSIDIATHEIVWQCPVCFDNGKISNWEFTYWDLRKKNFQLVKIYL